MCWSPNQRIRKADGQLEADITICGGYNRWARDTGHTTTAAEVGFDPMVGSVLTADEGQTKYRCHACLHVAQTENESTARQPGTNHLILQTLPTDNISANKPCIKKPHHPRPTMVDPAAPPRRCRTSKPITPHEINNKHILDDCGCAVAPFFIHAAMK